MITQEHWQRIKAIFHSAQECAPADRASFLNTACGDDDSIRQEVESLLAADETNEDFLRAPAYELMAGVLADKKAEFVAGQEIGPYTILSSLGAGGMGEVYLAKDARLGRKVALKLLPFDIARDRRRVRRLEQEARAASALNHPNVCTIHEIGETNNGRHFIAMEYIDGLTLRDRMAQKQMKLLEALDVAAQVAWALEAAHAAGIVHRDIKPENIMLRKDGYVKVLDFGIAKLNERLSKLNDINEASTIDKVQTEPGTRVGTVNYMSPEQLRELSVDARTDIWSLGVVLHEMVTGTTPFGARTENETIAAILDRQPIEFAPSNEVPAAFQHIVERALRKKRLERYQRVKDLVDDLRKLRQQIATNTSQEFSSQPMSSRQSSEDSPALLAVDGDGRSTALERTKAFAVRTAELILSEIKEHPKATTFAGLTALFAVLLIGPNLPHLSNRLRGLFNPPRQQSISGLQTTRMIPLTNSGTSVCAAISPDGKYVAHVEKKDGMQQLVLYGLATSGTSVVVPPDSVDYHGVTFSPDGYYLYFTSARPEKGDAVTLYRVSLPGGSPKKIKDRVDSPIAFSPTGDRFVFVRSDSARGEYLLIIADVDGTGERVIATRQNGNRFSLGGPSWSPDGKKIVCGTGWWDKGYQMSLIQVNVEDGSENTVSGQHWFSIQQTAWLEDNSGLIISAKEQPLNPYQLWRISYPEGEVVRITNDRTYYEGAGLSRDGKSIVSVQSHQVAQIWVLPDGDVLRARPITSTVGLSYGVGWTGEGRIVFSSMAQDRLNISRVDPDGSNQTQLTANAGDNYTPAISPDGRLIVFASNRTGSFNIWRMNAEDGSDLRQLTFSDGNSYPSFLPDGQWIVYDNSSNAMPTVWKVSIDGGEPVKLTDKYARMPVVSPDNQFIACRYYVDEGLRGIAIIPMQGGTPVKLLPIPIMEWQRVQWLADGRALAYIKTVNGTSNVWSYTLDSHSTKQLTDFKDERIFAYSWSPDYKELACERGTETRDVTLINIEK
jgi:serine/threonine protein kinase/Tol biopolymer transport system component